MKMLFRRRRCGICGRKPTVTITKSRLKSTPHLQVWFCRTYCRHCPENTTVGAANNKEFAKHRAVNQWNRLQRIYVKRAARLLERFLTNQ